MVPPPPGGMLLDLLLLLARHYPLDDLPGAFHQPPAAGIFVEYLRRARKIIQDGSQQQRNKKQGQRAYGVENAFCIVFKNASPRLQTAPHHGYHPVTTVSTNPSVVGGTTLFRCGWTTTNRVALRPISPTHATPARLEATSGGTQVALRYQTPPPPNASALAIEERWAVVLRVAQTTSRFHKRLASSLFAIDSNVLRAEKSSRDVSLARGKKHLKFHARP